MNEYEATIAGALKRKGWTVLTKGWPDFLCVNWSEDQIKTAATNQRNLSSLMRSQPLHAFCVELKRGKDVVRPEQAAMHAMLNAIGVHCRVCRESDVDVLLKKSGNKTIFSTPEQRSLLKSKVEDMERELEWKLKELGKLKKSVEASTVLFDGEDPECRFAAPEDERLSSGPMVDPTTTMERVALSLLSGGRAA